MDRSYVAGILSDRLEGFMLELQRDVKITETNIHEKVLERPGLAAKWGRYSYEEERYLKKLKDAAEKYQQVIVQKLYGSKKQAITSGTGADIIINKQAKDLLKSDDKYLKLMTEIENQEEIIRFIGEAKQIMYSFGYDCKNAIEVMKLETI